MITIKLPGKIIISAAAIAGVLMTLSFLGSFHGGNGSLHPVITRDLPFAKPADTSAPLRVAIYPGGAFAAGLLANGGLVTAKDSLFEKEFKLGVEFIIVEDPERCMALLGREGGADIVWSSLPVLANQYKKYCSINPVVFMQYGYSRGEDALYGNRVFTGPGELKGATVACVHGGNPHFLLLFMLSAAGIDPGDIKWKYTTTDGDAVLLVQKGRAQLCVISTATATVPPDFKLIFSSSQASKLLPGVFVTREDILIGKKERIGRFAAGWFRGISELQRNRDSAVKLLVKSFGCDEKKGEELLRSSLHTGFTDNSVFFRIGQGQIPGFDHLAGLSASLLGQRKEISRPLCESTKNTDILVSINESMKKTGTGFDAGKADTLLNPSLSPLSREYPVVFSPQDYSVDFRASMAVESFSRIAGLFEGSPVYLYGRAGSPEEKAYSYNWGMRFYIVGKLLTDLGIPKERIIIKEILHDSSLTGGQKHLVSCVIGR